MILTMLPIALLAAAQRSVSGDFDHDGRPDQAIVEPAEAGQKEGGHRLVVRHGSGAVSTIDGDLGDPTNLYVKRAAPGEVATACADPRASRAACPADALPEGDALLFGTAEASAAVALWTGTRFEMVWIGD